jgi:cytochrome c oxidase subunit 2
MRFSLPEASTGAANVDWLIGGLLLVSAAVLGLVFFLLFFYVIRYRHDSPIRRGEIAEKSFRFEITWTIATLAVF